jgi:hypothetical protein
VADCYDKKIADEHYGYKTPNLGNHDNSFRGRGNLYTPRGRGGYRPQRFPNPFAPQSQTPTPPQMPSPYPGPFNRLRILEQGFPDEDSTSIAPAPSENTAGLSQTPGKE